MRTDDLICMMAKTPPCSCTKRNIIIWAGVALLFTAMVSVVAFALGPRPDFARAIAEYETIFKYAFLLALAAGAGIAWWRSGHPGHNARCAQYGLFGLAFVLLAADIVLLSNVPHEAGADDAVLEESAYICAAFIALFSVAGSAVLTFLSGCMAPTNCRRHAFLTALFATALGALAYAFHCQNDNPLYVALWYGGAGMAVTLASVPLLMKKQAW